MSFQSQNMQGENRLRLGLFVLASGLEKCWKKICQACVLSPRSWSLQALKAAAADFSLLLCRQTRDAREWFTQILILSCVTVP